MKAFDKIIGYESIKNELYQIIDMFKNPDLYKNMGASQIKGILIHGKPGLGKTMLANAFIEECGVKSFILKKNKDNKETINEISEVFRKAAQEEAAIILIDDIDKYSESSSYDVDDQAFSAIQSAIDGVKDKNVLVIATANRIDKLSSSLKRKGRFDITIYLQTPTQDDARKIIEYYLSSKKVSPTLNYTDVANMISYTSCAELESIINQSAIYATFDRKEYIDIDDIIKAYLFDGYEDQDETYQLDKRDIETAALHEAGHACVAETIKKGGVGFVSIQTTGRSRAGGFTHLCEEYKRRPECILIALAGKAAVELFYEGRCGSGCQSDLGRAVGMIRSGVGESGTCGLGMLDLGTEFTPSSQKWLENSEAVTIAELERYLFLVRDILIKNKDFLMKLSEQLLKKKRLLYSEIKEIRDSVEIVETVVQ